MKICVQCGGNLIRAFETIETQVDEHTFVVEAPAQECTKCGEKYVTGVVHENLDLLVAQKLSQAGILSGAVFRFMRKTLGLRAVQLAQLLSVTAETVSRWETEKREVDRAAFVVVGTMISDALAHRTDTIDRLRVLVEPKPLAVVTNLGRITADFSV